MPWYVKDYTTNASTWGYAEGSLEANSNALMIWSILGVHGWSENAVSAVCGNIQYESRMNPWLWQSGIKLNSSDYSGIHTQNGHAYGLCQWDPASKYIDNGTSYSGYGPHYSNQTGSYNEGDAQMLYLDAHGASNWFPRGGHNMTFNEFKNSMLSVSYLAEVWLYNYEFPGNIQQQIPLRAASANYYYSVIHGTPPGPTPTRRKGMPLWMKTIPYLNQY